MTASRGCIVVFAREPVPGFTKTRLHPVLGHEGAAALARKMALHTLDKVCPDSMAEVKLYVSGHVAGGFLDACGRDYRIAIKQQTGADLGRCMYNAFKHELEYFDWVVLIGTDCPGMTLHDLQRASSVLQQGEDAVIGPAIDGGYYLIGLRQNDESLFRNIQWGTDSVYEHTLHRMTELGWKAVALPARHDIDVPEDLGHLPTLPGGDWFT